MVQPTFIISNIFDMIPGLKGEQAPLTHSRVKFLTNSCVYSIRRAEKELGYMPKVTLEVGMKRTAE